MSYLDLLSIEHKALICQYLDGNDAINLINIHDNLISGYILIIYILSGMTIPDGYPKKMYLQMIRGITNINKKTWKTKDIKLKIVYEIIRISLKYPNAQKIIKDVFGRPGVSEKISYSITDSGIIVIQDIQDILQDNCSKDLEKLLNGTKISTDNKIELINELNKLIFVNFDKLIILSLYNSVKHKDKLLFQYIVEGYPEIVFRREYLNLLALFLGHLLDQQLDNKKLKQIKMIVTLIKISQRENVLAQLKRFIGIKWIHNFFLCVSKF